MQFVYYKQPDSMDCGPTCLRMVAKHYKRNISLQSLGEKTQIGKEGVNLLGISEAAEAVGFRTQSVKLNYDTLIKDAKLPAILHWRQNHFVVLYKTSPPNPLKKFFFRFPSPSEKVAEGRMRSRGGKLHVADPAKGLITYTSKEFKGHWVSDKTNGEEGIALLLEPSPAFYLTPTLSIGDGDGEGRLHFKNIFNYILPYKKLVTQLFIGLGVASLLQLFLPFLTQSIVDVGINTANIHFVYIILLAQLALFAGKIGVEFVRSWILLHISTRINISILTDFLIKLMKLPVSFFDSKHTGDILQRMNDHSRIESFLTGSSLNTLFSLLNLVIFSVVLAIFNMSIFIVFAIASILYAIWVVLFLKKRKQLDYKRFEVAAKEQGLTIQLIQGMQEIKLNGVEKSMRWGWEGLQARLFGLSMKGLSLNQWQQAGAFFINEGKNIFITFLSAKAVIDGQMTLGSMLAVQYIIGQLNSPIEQMIGFIQSWQNAKISMDRLNEIHTVEDEEPAYKNLQQQLPVAFTRKLTGGGNLTPALSTKGGEGAVAPTQPLLFRDASNGENFFRPQATHENKTSSAFNDIPQNAVSSQSEVCALGSPSPSLMERAGVRFSNVSFTYPGAGNEPVLKDINLSIPKGKTTAIVGVSGSGKTTLLKLLLKFYEPQKGDIRLVSNLTPTLSTFGREGRTAIAQPMLFNDTAFNTDSLQSEVCALDSPSPSLMEREGVRLSSISHKVWRSHCGVVMQESFIFSDTIARNIAVGAERIDMDKLNQAVEVANIREFVESLPLGYNTKIGAEGTGISMGQKQRLLIARAVYRNPEFIFFDEATNSLDANNETVIIQNLANFFTGKTVVVVAHRLSTVKHADQIIVLNKGTVAERGTHQELVNLKGEYYTLVKNQLELGA